MIKMVMRFYICLLTRFLCLAAIAAANNAATNNDPSHEFVSKVRTNLMNMMTHSLQLDHARRSLSLGDNVGCHLAADNTTRVCQGKDTLGGMNVLYGSTCPVTASGLKDCTCQISTAHNNQTCQSCSFCDNSGAFSLDCRNVLISDYTCAGVDCYDHCMGRGHGHFDPSIVITFNNNNNNNTATSGGTERYVTAPTPLLVLLATATIIGWML